MNSMLLDAENLQLYDFCKTTLFSLSVSACTATTLGIQILLTPTPWWKEFAMWFDKLLNYKGELHAKKKHLLEQNKYVE
jgi:hypothetical protein